MMQMEVDSDSAKNEMMDPSEDLDENEKEEEEKLKKWKEHSWSKHNLETRCFPE